MAKILIKCDGCKGEFQTDRTPEIPENCTYLTCNWCPICEDNADDYYNEEYHYEELPTEPDPNQIKLDI